MKTFALLSALSALASAATVTLKETPCIQETRLETFTIGTDGLVKRELESVCGLEIVSVSGADINAISCQAYRDSDGEQPGSAVFTFAKPALISTNPVQERSLRCNSTGSATGGSGANTSGSPTTLTTGTLASTATGGNSVPTGSGNNTVPSGSGGPSRTPSAAGSSPSPSSTGAASHMGTSVGAIVAGMGFAALLL